MGAAAAGKNPTLMLKSRQTDKLYFAFPALKGLFAVLEELLFAECHPLVTLLSSELICLPTLGFVWKHSIW